jgi:hypothetical protein
VVDLGIALAALSGAAVFAGFLFNGLQTRFAAEQRRQSAAAEIVHSFQGGAFIAAAQMMWELRPGMSGPELRAEGPGTIGAVHNVGVIYETLGVLVHRRIVPIDFVEDVMGGAILYMWTVAKGYVEAERVRQARPSVYEWWQWLAERLEERAPREKSVPAHEAFRDWKP